jgi:hypothetical protein
MVSCAAARFDFSGIEKQGHADDAQGNLGVKHKNSCSYAQSVFNRLPVVRRNTDDTSKDRTAMCLGDCFRAQRYMGRVSTVF